MRSVADEEGEQSAGAFDQDARKAHEAGKRPTRAVPSASPARGPEFAEAPPSQLEERTRREWLGRTVRTSSAPRQAQPWTPSTGSAAFTDSTQEASLGTEELGSARPAAPGDSIPISHWCWFATSRRTSIGPVVRGRELAQKRRKRNWCPARARDVERVGSPHLRARRGPGLRPGRTGTPGRIARIPGFILAGLIRYRARNAARWGEKGASSIGRGLSSTAADTASAVMGASRMPFRVWPVA